MLLPRVLALLAVGLIACGDDVSPPPPSDSGGMDARTGTDASSPDARTDMDAATPPDAPAGDDASVGDDASMTDGGDRDGGGEVDAGSGMDAAIRDGGSDAGRVTDAGTVTDAGPGPDGAVCGPIGMRCQPAMGRDCPSGYTCAGLGGPAAIGVCIPDTMETCGIVECPMSVPTCLLPTGSTGGPCVTTEDARCVCASRTGRMLFDLTCSMF